MSLQIPTLNDQDSAGVTEVSEVVFGCNFNEALVHQLITSYLAGSRAGTKAQKNRSDVSGGGKKPYRQKGTGRARAGTTRSPLWRTGGVTFAARPRSFEQKLNKKMYKGGIKSIVSELLRQNRLVVSNDILPKTPKTKEFYGQIKRFAGKNLLVITKLEDRNLVLASRNIPNVEIAYADAINPLQLVAADKVIVTADAIKKIEEHLL